MCANAPKDGLVNAVNSRSVQLHVQMEGPALLLTHVNAPKSGVDPCATSQFVMGSQQHRGLVHRMGDALSLPNVAVMRVGLVMTAASQYVQVY